VQIAESSGGRRKIVAHAGSAHTGAELGILLEQARGMLSDPAQGTFDLEIGCFEGNQAEKLTILPVVRQFQARHGVEGMVVVADAGMLPAGNLAELDDAGLGALPARRPIAEAGGERVGERKPSKHAHSSNFVTFVTFRLDLAADGITQWCRAPASSRSESRDQSHVWSGCVCAADVAST
jgi:hypothetical protein